MTPSWSKLTVVAALLALLLAGCGTPKRNLAQYNDMPDSAQRGRLNATDQVDESRPSWLHETRPAWTR
jgi:hypothetical protein